MKRAPSVKQPGPTLKRIAPVGREQVEGWGQGRAAGWRAIRERILRRDGGLCQCHECKEAGRYEVAHMVDHIDNRRGAGYNDDSNMAAINRQCHERKSQIEARIGRGLMDRPAWMDRYKQGEGGALEAATGHRPDDVGAETSTPGME